ncbi:MAG: histidinol dehydrogenase [Armatimonadota bacterium]|nr:histidinol dehydrogenase [Armatimonadota bacterium]
MSDPGFVVRSLADLPPVEARRRLDRSAPAIFSDAMRTYAHQVLEDVARDGDDAVAAYTARWDRVVVRPEELAVPAAAMAHAHRQVDADLRRALEASILRARRYNEWLRPPAMMLEEIEPGVTVGIRYTPCRSAGLYVPSRKGTFPSTLITLAVPAAVAGVEELVGVVPPRSDGSVDPAVLVAADLVGLRRVFRCNGPAGVAALAVGTAHIPKTDVVVGPGNPVVAAVQAAAASYGVRSLVTLGPTESIVLADDSADPDRLALDLLNEAEHGGDSAVILLVTDRSVAERTARRLDARLAELPEPRRTYARQALTDLGGLFLVQDLDEGLAWINRYAPEHLQLAVRDPLGVAARVHHAGEILVGQHTPFSLANYAIGVPAALPTGGAGFAASGVTVLSFLKTISVASLSAEGLRALGPVAVRLGQHEDFPAHVLAVTGREGLPG